MAQVRSVGALVWPNLSFLNPLKSLNRFCRLFVFDLYFASFSCLKIRLHPTAWSRVPPATAVSPSPLRDFHSAGRSAKVQRKFKNLRESHSCCSNSRSPGSCCLDLVPKNDDGSVVSFVTTVLVVVETDWLKHWSSNLCFFRGSHKLSKAQKQSHKYSNYISLPSIYMSGSELVSSKMKTSVDNLWQTPRQTGQTSGRCLEPRCSVSASPDICQCSSVLAQRRQRRSCTPQGSPLWTEARRHLLSTPSKDP